VCHKPKVYSTNSMITCSLPAYNTNLYDTTNLVYDTGTTVFLSNKTPIYRKYITDKEVFKLII
jgi:hypothetical protein